MLRRFLWWIMQQLLQRLLSLALAHAAPSLARVIAGALGPLVRAELPGVALTLAERRALLGFVADTMAGRVFTLAPIGPLSVGDVDHIVKGLAQGVPEVIAAYLTEANLTADAAAIRSTLALALDALDA